MWKALALVVCGCTAGLQLNATGSGVAVGPPAQATAHAEASVSIHFFGIPLVGRDRVVFVLDRSGSMAGVSTGFAGSAVGMSQTESTIAGLGGTLANMAAGSPLPDKLEVAKHELARTIASMPDGTQIDIVFFDEEVAALSPTLMVLTPESRAQIATFLASIKPRGSTAAVPALQAALTAGGANIVLLSDGLANTGGDGDDLLALARGAMSTGVRFDTVGVGLDQDASLLQTMAVESGGMSVMR